MIARRSPPAFGCNQTRVPTRTRAVSTERGSMIRTLPRSAWSSDARAERNSCRARAAWYSKFSERSPCARASWIARSVSGISFSRRLRSSSCSRVTVAGERRDHVRLGGP